MLAIPVLALQERINASPALVAGFNLMQVLKDEAIVPNGVIPFMAGGAPRDVIFHNTEPTDIDIFLAAGTTGLRGNMHITAEIRENLILWLDDMDISYTSLVDPTIAARYSTITDPLLEILDFEFEGQHCQVMIPTQLRVGFENFFDRFPAYSQVALSSEHLVATDVGFCSQYTSLRPALSETDVQYLMHKYPNDRWMPFGSRSSLLEHAIAQSPEVYADFNGYINDQAILPGVSSVFGMNHVLHRLKRFAALKLNIAPHHINQGGGVVHNTTYRADRTAVLERTPTGPVPPRVAQAAQFFGGAVAQPSSRW